jgi:hypothetical protein
MLKKEIVLFISFVFFITGCSSKAQNSVETNMKMQKFNALVQDKFLCSAIVPSDYGKKNKKVEYRINFKNYPKKVSINCQDTTDVDYLDGECNKDIYEEFLDRGYKSNCLVYTRDNIIYPVDGRNGDSHIVINDTNGSQLKLKIYGYNPKYSKSLILTCKKPSELMDTTISDTPQKFERSPYTDEELKKQLDRQLQRNLSEDKLKKIEKIVNYGVYISIDDLYKALGVESDYVADYRVFRLLLKRANISVDELFSHKLIKKYYNRYGTGVILGEAISMGNYNDSNLAMQNSLALAKFLTKTSKFDSVILSFIQEEDHKPKYNKNIPAITIEYLIDYILSKNIGYDKSIYLLVSHYAYSNNLEKTSKQLIQIIKQYSQADTNYLNLFIDTYMYLGSKHEILQKLKKKGYFIYRNFEYNYQNNLGKNCSTYRMDHFQQFYAVLKAFLEQNYKPNKITIKMYNNIKDILHKNIKAHRYTGCKNIIKKEHTSIYYKPEQLQKIIELLESYNLADNSHSLSLQRSLADVINKKDSRGALFYINKGAKGDEKILISSIKNDMPNIFKMLLEQNFPFDQEKILYKNRRYKTIQRSRLKYIDILVDNNKLSKKYIDDVAYQVARFNDKELLKKLINYGADQTFLMKKAIEKRDEKVMNLLLDVTSDNELKNMYSSYQKDKKNREKEAKLRAKKEEKRRQEQKAREQKAYMAKKHKGQKVCKDGRMALFLNITITAYVEGLNGDSIKLRIVDTEGTTPNYNGVSLYRDTIIWDKYYNWKDCSF